MFLPLRFQDLLQRHRPGISSGMGLPGEEGE